MDLPLRYDITIAQGATYRERFQLPIDCTDREVVAQVWSTRNGRKTTKLLDLQVDWIDRAVVIPVTVDGETTNVTYGDFYLVCGWEETQALDGPGIWDLLLVEGEGLERAGERRYWIEGVARFNPGMSAAAGGP